MDRLLLDKWLRFLATTNGRDKVYRVVQYASKLMAHYLLRLDRKSPVGARLLLLSVALGQGRKLFRMGKPAEHLRLAWRVMENDSIKEDVVKTLQITKFLGLAGWLLLDSMQWLNAMKVLQWPPATMLAINDLAPRLWLTGLIASFLYCCHQADAIVRENIQNSQHQNKSTYDIVRELFSANMRLRKLVYDMVQDVLDMSIPASQAGIVDLSAGTVGLCGTITSLMGLWTSWQGP